jgi:hypothetical protein
MNYNYFNVNGNIVAVPTTIIGGTYPQQGIMPNNRTVTISNNFTSASRFVPSTIAPTGTGTTSPLGQNLQPLISTRVSSHSANSTTNSTSLPANLNPIREEVTKEFHSCTLKVEKDNTFCISFKPFEGIDMSDMNLSSDDKSGHQWYKNTLNDDLHRTTYYILNNTNEISDQFNKIGGWNHHLYELLKNAWDSNSNAAKIKMDPLYDIKGKISIINDGKTQIELSDSGLGFTQFNDYNFHSFDEIQKTISDRRKKINTSSKAPYITFGGSGYGLEHTVTAAKDSGGSVKLQNLPEGGAKVTVIFNR